MMNQTTSKLAWYVRCAFYIGFRFNCILLSDFIIFIIIYNWCVFSVYRGNDEDIIDSVNHSLIFVRRQIPHLVSFKIFTNLKIVWRCPLSLWESNAHTLTTPPEIASLAALYLFQRWVVSFEEKPKQKEGGERGNRTHDLVHAKHALYPWASPPIVLDDASVPECCIYTRIYTLSTRVAIRKTVSSKGILKGVNIRLKLPFTWPHREAPLRIKVASNHKAPAGEPTAQRFEWGFYVALAPLVWAIIYLLGQVSMVFKVGRHIRLKMECIAQTFHISRKFTLRHDKKKLLAEWNIPFIGSEELSHLADFIFFSFFYFSLD